MEELLRNIMSSKDFKLKKKRSIRSPLPILGFIIGLMAVATLIIGPNNGDLNEEYLGSTDYEGDGDLTEDDSYPLTQVLTTVYGQNFPLSQYEGSPLILYFGAVDCSACSLMISDLVNTWNNYKNSGNLNMIGFDVWGTDLNDIKQWISDNSISWNVVRDDGGQMSSLFSIVSVPTIVVLDSNGNIDNKYVGAQSASTLNAIFQNALSL